MAKITTDLLFSIQANTASLKQQLDKANNNIKGFQKQVNGVGNAIKGAFAAGAIMAAGQKLIEFGKEASILAAKAEGIKSAFDRLNQPDLLNEMRDAVKGTVSDVDLMAAAVKANEFGIPVEKMATMMQFAAVQANKLGESTDYMVDSIVTGLARGSVQILDNLGLSAKQLNAEAKITGDVTSAAFNLMATKLEENGGLLDNTATKQAQWTATVQNTKVAFGDLVNKGVNAVTPVLYDVFAAVKTGFVKAKAYIIDFINGWIALYNESMEFRIVIEYIAFGFKQLFAGIKLGLSLIVDNIKHSAKIIGYVLNPKNWGEGFTEGFAELYGNAIGEMKDDVVEFGKTTYENFKKGFENVKKGNIELISTEDAIEAGVNASAGVKKGLEKGLKDKTPVVPIAIDETKFKKDFADFANTDEFDFNISPELDDVGKMEFVGDTIAYWNQELQKYNNHLDNTVIGSEDYVNTLGKIDEIQKRINGNQVTYIDKVNATADVFGNLNNLATAYGDLMIGVFGEEYRKDIEEITNAISGFMNILTSVTTILQTVNALQEAMNLLSTKHAAAKLAEAGAIGVETTATATSTGVKTAEAGATMIQTAAEGGKSVAKIPFVGAILAVAAIGAIIAAFVIGKKKLGKKALGGTAGGRTLVGEEGMELLDLPSGSRVHSAGRTTQLLSNGGGMQVVVLDTRISSGDIWLTQRDYNKRIGNNR